MSRLSTAAACAWLMASASAGAQSFDEVAAKARRALESDRVDEAVSLYRQATKLRPGWSEGWWRLGTLLYDARRFPEAGAAFRHFVEVERTQPGPGFGMLGLCEFAAKRYPEALSALERGIRRGIGTNPEFNRLVLYHSGILNSKFGRWEIALLRLTLLLNETAAAHQGVPPREFLSDRELVNAFGIAALQRPWLPEEIPAAQSGVVEQAGRARMLFGLQDWPVAGEEFRKLVTEYPREPGVHYAYGVFLVKIRPEDALAEFRREIELSPGDIDSRLQIALECLRNGDYAQGRKYAAEAVALAPEYFAARIANGRLLLALDEVAPAIKELELAVKLAPESPDARLALSRAYALANRPADAARERAEFERLQKLLEAASER